MSSAVQSYLWLIPGLPLLASALIAFLGPRFLKERSHWPCILAIGVSFVLSVLVFLTVRGASGEHPEGIATYYSWIRAGIFSWITQQPRVEVGINLRADALSATMLVMITFIGGLIAIYSVGYMHGDPGYPRFFACVALFIFAMTTLVLGDNFLVLFAGWEGVGLCSYLLIGFWFQKQSAADAARKAFLVTRIGDVGLMLGILMLWMMYGSLDYGVIFPQVTEQLTRETLSQPMIFAVALLLFCGAAGKSAQFPLHVWLPDAMEGPTPVSALIHAATMVTAGVYLLARCTPIFLAAPEAQLVVACIGGFTALLAALIALTQNDLKRVLAYSTLSQLGYMFLALGCALRAGGDSLVTFAVTAAMFHLFTHAFFKALLFLAAGSVMHSMGHVIDMRRFSGLRKVMPKTHQTFLCGALALAGFPLLSGFWSKDEILEACYQASTASTSAGNIYFLLLVVAVFTAGLTAFYTFRAYFKTFWGEVKVPEEAYAHGHGHDHDHGHGHAKDHGHGHATTPGQGQHERPTTLESPAVMTVPLMILSLFAVAVGLLLGPTHLFAHFLERTPGWPAVEQEAHLNYPLMLLSTLVGLAGILLAWVMYLKQPSLPVKLAQSMQGLYQLSLNKFYLDEIYSALLVRPLEALAALSRRVDSGGVDASVDLVGNSPRLLGELFRPIQNGLVQFYALAMVLGLTVFLLTLIHRL